MRLLSAVASLVISALPCFAAELNIDSKYCDDDSYIDRSGWHPREEGLDCTFTKVKRTTVGYGVTLGCPDGITKFAIILSDDKKTLTVRDGWQSHSLKRCPPY